MTDAEETRVAATAARFLRESHVRCAARGRRVEGLDFDGEVHPARSRRGWPAP